MYRISADSNMKLSFFLAFVLVEHCFALIDVNIHELQYVSDHLTYQECQRLSASLRLKTWDLPGNITGRGEPAVPCLLLLLRYDKEQGRGKTFHDLARRIQQIGRTDISKRLSRMVLLKKAGAIRKDFLDDPFKKMIGVTPFLLDYSLENNDDDVVEKNDDDDVGKGDDVGKEDDENNAESNKKLTENISSSEWFNEFISGLSSSNIALCQVALLSILLLLMTFCIFGCPQFVKKCCKCCTPRPLAGCINDVCDFLRVDLVVCLREACQKTSAPELDTEAEMTERLLPP